MKPALAVALSLLAFGAAACGEDKKETYSKDYKPLNAKVLTLGEDLGTAVQGARGKSNAAVTADFEKLSSRFDTLSKDIEDLDPPDDLKDESKALTGELGSLGDDSSAIAKAVSDNDVNAARTATMKLLRDAAKTNATQNKLAKATGAKVGDS